MVRVLLYHHFGSQDVLPTDDEPVALYCTFDKAFVATASCNIEVFKITKDGHEKIAKFPTVALVKQLVYDETENLIATLEEKPSKSGHQGSVRVYGNWDADLSQRPMRARIAGHAASIRHEDRDQSDQFEMIEIPLKGEPSCISIGKSLGGIGVAVEDTLLIYAYVQKRVAETTETYRDLKCVLEITFNFYLNEIALCEEYIAGCSDDEFQVIKLKVSRNLSSSSLKRREHVCDVSTMDCAPSSPTKSGASRTSSSTSLHDGSSLLFGFQNRKTYSSSSSLSSMVSSQSTDTAGNNPYIVEDEFHVVWDFDKEAEGEIHVPHASAVAAAPSRPGPPKLMRSSSSQIGKPKPTVSKTVKPPGRTLILKSMENHVQQKKDKLKPMMDKHGELIGPLTDAFECPVSVDYEHDAGGLEGNTRLGFLDGTVYTMIYRKFEEGTKLHSLKMDATYITDISDVTRLTGRMKRNMSEVFIGSPDKDDKKVGVTVFISNDQEGCMYEIHRKIKLLANYPYTARCLQVTGSKFLLYAITEAGLEIYTTRGFASALHQILEFDNVTNTFPSAELDTCLVGLQPFIGANCLDTSFRCLIMLTKHNIPSSKKSEESNWSLYKLTQPSVEELYNDMTELATRHKESSPPAYLHLLLEVQLLMRAYLWASGTKDPVIKQLLAKCCAMLAEFYSGKSAENWELALPYYRMSKMSVSDILKQSYSVNGKTKEMKLVEYGKGLFHYFDYTIFHGEEPLQVTEEEGNIIIEMFAHSEPYKLSTVMLCSRLKSYSNDKAMALLQTWMNKKKPEALKSKRNKKLDMLALAVLNLKLCDPEAAQAALSSLKTNDLISSCVDYHEMLHEDFKSFSHLAQLLRRYQPRVFLQILVELHDKGIISLDLALTLLQDGCDSADLYQNAHVREFLEVLLSDRKREYIFSDAVKHVVDIYLRRLADWREPTSPQQSPVTIREVIPRGYGHFAKRFNWLNELPPFQGGENLKKPCQYLIKKRQGNAASKPVTISATGESKQTPENSMVCGCCNCNIDLLKLQSILCSDLTGKDTIQLLMSELADSKNMRGYESVMILCLSRVNPNSAVDMMIESYPKILAAFAAEMFGSDHLLWSHIVDNLSTMVQTSPTALETNNMKLDTYKDTYAAVLKESSVLLTPVDFLNLLPRDGNAKFFLPFIEKSYRHYQALQLKETIIQKGEQLAQSV